MHQFRHALPCRLAGQPRLAAATPSVVYPAPLELGPVGLQKGKGMASVLYDNRYTISAPDVVSEDFNGQVVILNLSDGRYFSLSGIASSLWNSLLAGQTPQAIFESIREHRPDLSDEAARFVDRLLELKLIRPDEGAEASITCAISETWIGDTPRVDVFDDLAELIFADPIHDVDEQAGWPAPRPEPSK
jgi:hypothetical protein